MRIIFFFLLLFPLTIFASTHLTCYSHGKLIYSGRVEGLLREDGMFLFKEPHHEGVMFIDANCVAKVSE